MTTTRDKELGGLPVWRKVYLFASNVAGTAWEWLTVDANRNLNVNLAASSKPLTVDNLASDSFSASGGGQTFGTVWANVEDYVGFGVWVLNTTATNNISRIQLEVAELTAGGGQGGLMAEGVLPASLSKTNFLVEIGGGIYFYNSPGFLFNFSFRSIRLGVRLTAPTAQTIQLAYKGYKV